ncbi:unnamed protein product [Mytilus edulis]|uniref:Uncharacterized protein n=1 Tax=Mytilus edulis TaxID=6550 RepID=A0A8S3QEH6_MYTED|nr:unnamed protein product [Mytilus edulis]
MYQLLAIFNNKLFIHKYTLIFDIELTALTAELQQHGNPVFGSKGVQLSCISQTEDDEVINTVIFLSKSGETDFKGVIIFNIKDNETKIIPPGGNYLKGELHSSICYCQKNRTVVEYNRITCEDNTEYRCDVQLQETYRTEISNLHSIEVKGTPNKPDTFPVRTPGLDICPGINVNYSCTGNVGTPPDQPEQLPIEGDDFADTAAGLATIAVVSVGGAVLTSIVLFKIIKKVKHLRMLKTIGVKDVEIVNNADPDNEATQGIDDEGFVSEVSQQWKNNAPIQSTM